MGVEVAAAAALVGTGVTAYGQYQSSKAQAKAAEQQAKIKRQQAAEMLDRMALEEKNIEQQGEEFKAQQKASYAKGGVEVGTGAALIAMEDTQYKITKQVQTMQRDTIFRANQLLQGASFDVAYAQDVKSAGAITAAGTLLQGGAKYYKATG